MNAAGMVLRVFREIRGLSQDQAGKAIGVLGQQIGVWERGVNTPRVDRFDAYAELVRAPVDLAMALIRDKTATPIEGLHMAVKYLMENEGLSEDEIRRITAWREMYGDRAIREILDQER